MTDHSHATRPSLLLRLRGEDGNMEDWDRLYQLYAPLVYQYARDRRLSHELAQDVLQETFVTLQQALPRFEYEPRRGRFRSWLLRVVHSRIVDAVRRERRFVGLDEQEAQALPDVDGQSPAEDLAADWDAMWRRNLLAQALETLKQRVQPGTYDVFQRVALDGEAVDAVAADLGVDRNTIYQQKHRLIARLQQIVAELEQELGEG